MRIEIKGTSDGRFGTIILEDKGEDCYSVTVTNGRTGEFSKEIKMVIFKEDIKRLAKAS